jgi:hypothetical protein
MKKIIRFGKRVDPKSNYQLVNLTRNKIYQMQINAPIK